MKKPILVLTILIFIIVTLFGVRAVVSNKLSTSGVALGKIQDEVKKYKIHNAILREKLFTLSSLSRISELASKKGFVESKSTFALTKGHPIAKAQ